MLSGSNLGNCIGGGEDYRTVNNNTTEDFLYIRGFHGDNISDACLITKVDVKGCYCKITNTSGGYATALVSGQVCRSPVVSQGSVSGTTFNRISGTNLMRGYEFVSVARNSTTAVKDITWNIDGAEEKFRQANKMYPGVCVKFKSSDHIRMYIKWINIVVTRTRACYITFTGDNVTETKTMYDYGTVPSFGSTPSRSGYTFKGWSNGSTTYSGTLPTAYEQDVTYTAVWEKNKVPCTITYNGNGANLGSVSAQSGYVGENLTLASNSFIKRACVELYSNDIDGCEYNEDEDAINPPLLSDASFLGWYTAAEGGTKVGDGGASYTPSGNVTLYAHWSGYPAVTLPTLTREGYAFLGWYDGREGGTKAADGGESYTPVQSYKPFFAHWEEIVVPPEIMSATITYGGAQVSAQNKVPTGEGYLIAVGIK